MKNILYVISVILMVSCLGHIEKESEKKEMVKENHDKFLYDSLNFGYLFDQCKLDYYILLKDSTYKSRAYVQQYIMDSVQLSDGKLKYIMTKEMNNNLILTELWLLHDDYIDNDTVITKIRLNRYDKILNSLNFIKEKTSLIPQVKTAIEFDENGLLTVKAIYTIYKSQNGHSIYN